MKYILLATVSLVAVCPASVALAQTSQESEGASLGDIVVTAQRRSERIEDVPMAITAIMPEAAEARGIRNAQDLGQAIAGVQVNFQGAYTYPSVRGVTSLTTGVGFENNVALYIDGFYQPDSIAVNADFANIESLQVLKGPQGALYGRNATGGALLITTLKPADTLTGKVDLRYGRFNDASLSGFISGPLSDSIRVSLAGYGRRSDGYYDALDAAGKKIGNAAPLRSYAGRAKVELDLSDSLTATLGYNYTNHRDPRGSMYNNEFNRPATLPPKVGRLYDPRTFATNRNTKNIAEINEGTLTLAWDTPIGMLTSRSSYADRNLTVIFDFDASWADLSYSRTFYKEKTFQQGVDLNVDTIDNLDLIVGGIYYDDQTRTVFNESYSTGQLRTRSSANSLQHSWSFYADASYHLNEQLTFTLGARYTMERREARLTSRVFPSGDLAAPPLTGAKRKFNDFSPHASVRYEIEPGTNIYAQVSRGFRSGFVQGTATLGQVLVSDIKPEKITAYEIGFKTARDQFRFDTAAYYYDYRNLQVGVTVPNPLNPATPINLTSNAPKAEIYGAEAQATFLPIESLEIDASVAYVHARYKDFKNATGTGLNAATGLNIANQSQNWSNQEMARAPGFSATLGVNYTINDVLGGKIATNANYKYTDSYVLNSPSLFGPLAGATLANKQRYRQSAYSLVNASINWTDGSDHLTIGIFGNNIFDKDYRLSQNGSAFGTYGTWASPATYGARLGYRF